MKNLTLGILIGSVMTTALVGAADYLGGGNGHYLTPGQEIQGILADTRVRQALETIEMQRQDYLDQQVRDAGKLPCR